MPRLPSPWTLPLALLGGSQGVPWPAEWHSNSSVSSMPGTHQIQMPEPPQLAPLDVEEQWLYSELPPGDRAPHPISKGAPHHPAEETHFGRLYLGSYSFGHDPKFRNVDWLVNREVHLLVQLSLHQDRPMDRPHYCSLSACQSHAPSFPHSWTRPRYPLRPLTAPRYSVHENNEKNWWQRAALPDSNMHREQVWLTDGNANQAPAPGPAGKDPATRHSPVSPNPRPGSRVGPGNAIPCFYICHQGHWNRS